MHLPCGGLLDKCRLHPVADAAWLKLVVMMMMADDRLLLETLHRRAAHVQRLLQAEHGRRGGRADSDNKPRDSRDASAANSPSGTGADQSKPTPRRTSSRCGRTTRPPPANGNRSEPDRFRSTKTSAREISADLQLNRDLRAAGESLFFDYIDRHTTRSGLYAAGCLHVRRRTSPSLSQSGAASPGRGVAAPS